MPRQMEIDRAALIARDAIMQWALHPDNYHVLYGIARKYLDEEAKAGGPYFVSTGEK